MHIKYVKPSAIIIIFLITCSVSFSQHRGDNLSYQGLTSVTDTDVKSAAMAGAATAGSGELFSLFTNPAGLIGIDGLQISVTGSYSSNHWRENQNYRPNRLFVTLPFYLEGLYTPDPADNGKFDHERMWNDDRTPDSTYFVNEPEMGLDPLSEEAADWKRNKNNFGLSNISAAYPFQIDGNMLVVSASYNRSIIVEDYDRNDTFLDPHPGYTEYGDISRVDGSDTLVMNWSRYIRQRSGSVSNITAALAYDLHEYINIGAGFNYGWGKTDDLQSLELIGTFDLVDENRFRFSYNDTFEETKGASEYSYNNFFFGLQLDFEQFKFGLKIDLPFTLTRDFDYETLYTDSVSLVKGNFTGTDKLDIPACFNFGIGFKPVDNFSLYVDYEYQPFNDASAKLFTNDTTFKSMPDRSVFKVGAEYSPFGFLTLMAGYRNIPSTFIPDGAAIKDRGPDADSYTIGLSINALFGRFDLAYEFRKLVYYDSYFSNTNYVTENFTNVLFGYVLSL
ncbi:MAG: hypothetical protein JW995_12825 [Melioribacteraceae bacterium]|nr:hypothetical protein [Melioribacteraceae bacterium]